MCIEKYCLFLSVRKYIQFYDMNTEKNQQVKNGENRKLELEVKKSAKVNLEQHSFTWLLMGFVIVFAVTFAVIVNPS